MKLLKQLLLLSLSILIISCGGDDDDPASGSNDLIGSWNLVDLNYSGTSTSEFFGQQIVSTFTGEGMNYNATVDINDDGTYSSQGSYDVEVTTVTSGFSDTSTTSFSGVFGVGTYTFDGTTMTVMDTQNNQTSSATITELTSSRMVISFQDESTFSEGGATVTQVLDVSYILEK